MDSARRSAIRVVERYLQDCVPECQWRKQAFLQMSYTKWAAEELLYALKTDLSRPPLLIIEDFADKMDQYSCKGKGRYAFSIAHDAALDILDILIN